MKELLQSLAKLGALAVLAGLVLTKISDTFPQIDGVGWLIITACFIAFIAIAIKLEALVAKKEGWWINGNETRRLYLITVAIWLLFILLVYLLWPMVETYLSPHFGKLAP